MKKFTFKTSISREGYPDKATAKACLSSISAKAIKREKMAFKQQEVTVDEFLNYAVNGYAFCNLFQFDKDKEYWVKSGNRWTKTTPIYKRGLNKGCFKLNFKSDEFFFGSQTVFVDIDYTHFQEISDYINSLTYKPTCAYTSYSDRANKLGIVSRRFRLVYVFDTILDKEQFKNITFYLYNTIVTDTDEPMYDSCGCSYSQYMNGSNSNETYSTNIIYKASDFIKHTEEIDDMYDIDELEEELENNITFSSELLDDMTYSPYEFVVRKWWAKGLRYFTQTEVEFNGFYTTTTEDFVRLPYSQEKIQDGHHRRKKLFVRACLRRLMKETTPDELLYNLYIDRNKFFNNEDGAIDLDCLQRKVVNAYKMDLDEIKEISKDFYKPKFVINPTTEDKRKAVADARTDITNTIISNIYDTSATVKANQETLKEAGYNVSISRLYKFCEEFNITPVKPTTRKKKEIKEGYNPNLSIRENMKVMGCTLYQVMKAKDIFNSTH